MNALNVLVTGAAGGMAQGVNAQLAKAGHTVICADLNIDAAQRAADAVIALGGKAVAFPLDVTSSTSVRELKLLIDASLGGIDALINLAGVLDRKFLKDHEDGTFEWALDINLSGPFRMIKEFGPQLVERGWGRIINISSIAGVTGYNYPSYAASKAGLSNLTRSLLIDFWGTGVTVNSICPGVVDTGMVIQEVRDQVTKKVPTETIIEPEEIGALINFVLTDAARNINGADLLIDGGATQVFSLFDR